MVVISTNNGSINNSNIGPTGHLLSLNSGISGLTGLTSNLNNNISPISQLNTIMNIPEPEISKLELSNNFANVKECLAENQNYMEKMFTCVNQELALIRIRIPIQFEKDMLPIDLEKLDLIYNCFIKPFIDCEIYRLGGMRLVIDLTNMLNLQIENVTNPKTKLVLYIFRDLIQVLINARNKFIDNISLEKELKFINSKYEECKHLVAKLEQKVKLLLDSDSSYVIGVMSGSLNISIWKPPPMIYIQAKFNIDYAWYIYLFKTTKIDVDKYESTIAYVRSFGTPKKAYDELIRLLDQMNKSFNEDIEEKLKKENKEVMEVEEVEQVEEVEKD